MNPDHRPLCRHCSAKRVNRPRGLCFPCFYAPGVRDLYPSTSKYSNRGYGNFAGLGLMPVAPTTAAPGSPEKVAVMEERAKRGERVNHAADARFEGDMRPVEWLEANTSQECA